MVVSNATLDGVNNFTILGQTYSWDGNFLEYVRADGPDSPDTSEVNLTLDGSNWTVRVLEFNGTGLTGTVTDAVGATGNRINLLRLGDGPTDITLINTRVRYFEAQSDSDYTITLGSQDTRAIDLNNGDNTINGGTGFIGSIMTGDGNDTVTLQSGADQISLGSGNNSITTGAQFVGSITMYSDSADVNTITIGSGGVRSIGVSNGRDRVTLQSGAFVEQLSVGSNNDTLTLRGDAWVNQANVGSGNNAVAVGAAHIGSLMAYDGNDTITVGSGMIEMLSMGDGNNRLTVGAGGYANVVRGDNGNDTVTLNGDARILMLKLDGGNNVLNTANGNVESYYSYGGNNTLNIGNGGIQQVVLSGDGGTHVVNATGFVGSLQVYDNASSTVTLNGGAIFVLTGKGSDVVTLGNGSFVGTLFTWQGNDQVTIGNGCTVESGEFGQGDDYVKLGAPGSSEVSELRGADGIDTLDLSLLTAGATLSIAVPGKWQALGTGTVALSGFENLVGSAFNDVLGGSADANTVSGANGNDTLSGLDGDDLLIGGRGNDSLTGGADADTFEFSAGGGRDRVTDFVAGVDLIHFTNAASLASITFAQSGANVLLTVGTAEVLVLNSTVAILNDAANFVF